MYAALSTLHEEICMDKQHGEVCDCEDCVNRCQKVEEAILGFCPDDYKEKFMGERLAMFNYVISNKLNPASVESMTITRDWLTEELSSYSR